MQLKHVTLPYLHDSHVYFDCIRHMDWPVWLDSGKPQQQRGRYDFISANPTQKFTLDRTGIQLNPNPENIPTNNLWETLNHLITHTGKITDNRFPFCGGLMGFLGYDANQETQHLDNSQNMTTPDAQLGLYEWLLIQDHQEKACHLIAQPSAITDKLFSDIQNRFVKASDQTQQPQKPYPFSIGPVTSNTPKADYLRSVDRIKDYILAGDCYQVNLSQRFQANYNGDPYTAYKALRNALPSQYSCYFETPESTLLSLSPECFLTGQTDGRITTKPIKGTLPRGKNKDEDEHLKQQLLNSEKDKAENLMIVDLLRNDLSKVCQNHSVKTEKLFDLESYANVHHLVSTVTGRREKDKNTLDTVKACFPGGSITGAPKKRAMEIIEELETSPRSVYCGSIGYIGFNGEIDMNIAIRSIVCDKEHLYCWAGGAIVTDSNPEQEYEESLNKIELIIQTLQQKFSSNT